MLPFYGNILLTLSQLLNSNFELVKRYLVYPILIKYSNKLIGYL